MMLLHCPASSSTFGAHPHHPERLPNPDLLVRAHPKNLMNMLPWMVRTSPLNLPDSMHPWTFKTTPPNFFLVPMLLSSTFL